jgi:hydrogenase maturation protease
VSEQAERLASTRVIGLGNTILSDDGVGVYAARLLAPLVCASGSIDVVESEVAGFALLELMHGFRRVALIDAICFDDVAPGTVVRLSADDLRTSLRIRSVHEIDLPTALALGRQLGFSMPEQVVIFGIQAADCWTLGEGLSLAVRQGMQRAVVELQAWLSGATAAPLSASTRMSDHYMFPPWRADEPTS